ncbi:MAG TPA: hypothetical protein VF701_15805 [Thermoanaerobaculia bacterium]
MKLRSEPQPKPRPRRVPVGALAVVGLLAVALGSAPYIAGRIAASRQRSEFDGVVTAKSVTVSQSQYGSRTGYWLEVRLVSGEVIRVKVPEHLHGSATVGSRIEKRDGDPLPKVSNPPVGPAV